MALDVIDSEDEKNTKDVTWLKSNKGVGLLLFGLFFLILLYIILFTDWSRPMRDGFPLGLFPIMSTVLCIASFVLIMVDHLRNRVEPGLAALNWKLSLALVGVVVWSGIFFWLLIHVGFVVTGPIYMFGLIYAMGLRPARTAFVAGLVVCIAIFVVFTVIGATLPIGPEWILEKLGLPATWGT